jgi:hypothetical protein
VEAHLFDHVEDVRPSEDEVLETLSKTVVGSWAIDRGAHVRGNLCLSVIPTSSRACSRSC